MLLISLCCLTWKERRGRVFWRWFWIQWNFVFIFFLKRIIWTMQSRRQHKVSFLISHTRRHLLLPTSLFVSTQTMTNHFTSAPKVHFTRTESFNIFRLPLTTSEVFGDKENSRTRSDPISRSSVAAETVGRSFQKLTQLTQRVQNGFKPFSQLTTVMPLLI